MNQQDYTRLCVIVGKQPQLSPYVKSYNSAKANHQPHQWIIVDPQTATAFNIVCQLWSRGIDVDSKDSLGPPYDEIFREVIKREMSVGQHYGPTLVERLLIAAQRRPSSVADEVIASPPLYRSIVKDEMRVAEWSTDSIVARLSPIDLVYTLTLLYLVYVDYIDELRTMVERLEGIV